LYIIRVLSIIEKILPSFYPMFVILVIIYDSLAMSHALPRTSLSVSFFLSFCASPYASRKSSGIFSLSAKRVTCVTKAIITITVDHENKLVCIGVCDVGCAPHFLNFIFNNCTMFVPIFIVNYNFVA